MDIPKLIWGMVVFQCCKHTPQFSHQSLINLFCLTGGAINSVLSLPLKILSRPYNFENNKHDGIFTSEVLNTLDSIQSHLKKDGYCILPERIPEATCDTLMQLALETPALIRGDAVTETLKGKYDPENLLGVRYDYDPNILANNDAVQLLFSNPMILAIAQNYLGSKPILDVIGMWWHTAFQKEPDAASAQYFHFDMDRIKWLKFFIYLTDVDEKNGPHVFVKGSHRNRGIPNKLRAKGYARLHDDDIYDCYDKGDIVHHNAPKGTIIAEDTRGLHKGKPVISGDRLVLQFQFSNHLFGATYPKYRISKFSEALRQSMLQYPKIFENYR